MENSKIKDQIIKANNSRMKYLSLICVGFSVFVLITDFLIQGVWQDESLYLYKVLDLVFAIVSVSAAFFFWSFKLNNSNLKKTGIVLFPFLIIILFSIITGIDFTTLGFSTLLSVMLIVTFFLYLNLTISLLYFVSSGFVLMATIYHKGNNNEQYLSILLTLIPIIGFSVLISVRNYKYKIKDLFNQEKMVDINKELHDFNQNLENIVEKRAAELIIANKELAFQNDEKEKRASELIIANKELVFQNEEKEKRAAELILANKDLAFQITEHNRAEKALKESEERFRTIFENSTIGIYRTTPEGQILLANPTLIKILGYSSFEELAKRNLTEVGFEPSYERTYFVDVMKKKGEVKAMESAWKKMDGTTLFISESARAINDEKGKTMYYDGIVEDVTLRNKAEKELILANKELVFQNEEKEKQAIELMNAKDKAEASDRLKTAFINNISHEIRTPLNGILGFAPFVIQSDITMEEKEEYLEILNVSSDRLMNTITDIMDISLLISGNMEVHPQPIDISLLLTNIFENFQKPSMKKNLELKMQFPENADSFILNTDGELLRKAVSKLVDNSVKFTKEGTITLGFERINNEIEIFVKDTGKGIEKDSQELIYKSFMQENASNTRGHEGNGLGLSISKGIMQLLGGEIRLESTKNRGTTVFLSLPNSTSTVSSKPKNSTNAIKVGEMPLILIAEDDDSSYSYEEILLRKDSKILRAYNGQEAVDLCKIHPDITLVLMDIKMPVMNGIEATHIIKSFRNNLPTKNAGIIYKGFIFAIPAARNSGVVGSGNKE